MALKIIINDQVCELRNDGTIYIGVDGYFREQGTRQWLSSDMCGRATLIPGKIYHVMVCPNGTRPGAPLTFWQKLNLLFSTGKWF